MNKAVEIYLERLNKNFPEFKSFKEGCDRFDKEERNYKFELIELYRKNVASSLKEFPEDEKSQIALGNRISALFTTRLAHSGNRPQNLVGFRYFTPVQFDGGDSAKWAQVVRALLIDNDELEDRIDTFVAELRLLIQEKIRNNNVAFNALSRSITSFLLMLAYPDKHAIIASQVFNRALKAFDNPKLEGPLSGPEYLRILQFLQTVKTKLEALNLRPRDMIDVQSFIWVGDPENYKLKPPNGPTKKPKKIATISPLPAVTSDDRPMNRIYYGPPGTGKTYQVEQLLKNYIDPDSLVRRFSWITFHQSYGYEEFVEGLRPVLDEVNVAGNVKYKLVDGAFKRLCTEARKAPGKRFAMVIDEINRGNISKIFGELITLIETDKRHKSGSPARIEVELAYSGEKFSVPDNVDIIGTMNTADRSLALVDTALRRRFEFEAVPPDTTDEEDSPLFGLTVTDVEDEIDIRTMLQRINERIEAIYDRDHMIGHSFFMPLRHIDDAQLRFAKLGEIFRQQIIPLLEEYFFEDWGKIQLVLGDNQKPLEARFIDRIEMKGNDLSKLFGKNHELDDYAVKPRFVLNPPAFGKFETYIGIYTDLEAQENNS